ncbi:MAG: ribosome biogenesis GTPase Der, partial [Oscillospiraceae bacterium]|nr:ribosome biogenesis GTPase Der [Oscillospiraceae bacterium]
VTRDRIYGDCEWCGRTFSLVDTGGIEPSTDNDMLKFMRRQAEIGIELADAIIMVTDVRSGVTAADEDVATMLRKSGKPVALAVNKCDSIGPVNPDVYEFYCLGIGDLFETSAIHGHGTGDLLDWVLANIPQDQEEEEEDGIIQVAIVGKPNVGKSSLLNRILGEERVIVSNIAGTTRDAIDSYFENETSKYCFIDTAGMRRKSKVDDAIEKYSNMRSVSAIDRADVCLILVDANEGVTEQDTKIAGLVHEAGKAAVIVVNKWDAVEDKQTNTMRDMETEVRQGLSYMLYAPVVFLSALTGARVDRLFQVIQEVYRQNTSRITTGQLNAVLADATARVQPPTDKGRRLKIYYMTQAGTKPPHFVIFCNDARLFHFSYQRYLENQIREVFGLQGTPIRITIRQKGDKEE